MSRSTRLIKALTADDIGNILAAVTPALDDSTKALATTEFLRQQFTGAGKRTLSQVGHLTLPGGFIINWGLLAQTNNTAMITASYEKPFPTAFLGAVVCGYVGNVPGGAGGAATYNHLNVDPKNLLNLAGTVLAPCTFSFLAWGY